MKLAGKRATWNLYLINRGEKPLCYFQGLSDREAQEWMMATANKAFDGSDADGFCMMRSDYPMPDIWPGKRG